MTATGPTASDSAVDAAEKAMQAERAHAARIRELAEKPAAAPAAAPAPTPRSTGFGPLVAGGVAAAVIGAGAAIWAVPHLPPQLAALIAQQDNSVATTLDEQARKITDLAAQVQTLANRPAPEHPVQDTSDLRAALDETAAQLRTLETRMSALEQRPVQTVSEPPAALQSEIETLKAQINAFTTEGITARVDAAATQAETRLKQSEAQAADLRTQAEEAAQKAIRQSVVARLAAAFDAGMPLGTIISDAQSTGLAVPDALLATVPTMATLQMDFPEAARLALAASRRAEAATGGIWQRLEALVKTQLGARSVTPQTGDSADAILSRATAAVSAGDIARAVTELGSLPQAGQDAISGWVALAQARLAAGAALADLTTAQQ